MLTVASRTCPEEVDRATRLMGLHRRAARLHHSRSKPNKK